MSAPGAHLSKYGILWFLLKENVGCWPSKLVILFCRTSCIYIYDFQNRVISWYFKKACLDGCSPIDDINPRVTLFHVFIPCKSKVLIFYSKVKSSYFGVMELFIRQSKADMQGKRNGNIHIETYKRIVFYGNGSNFKFHLLKFCNLIPHLHIIKTYHIFNSFL